MNLFENIFDKFTKQAQPMPSFGTPQAPRTNSYVAPNIPYSEQNTGTGFGSITQPKPINTSLPMGIPEPVFQKDPSDELKKEFGFNDTDIEFLRQAKKEGYDSDMAFEYITKKKQQEKQNIYSGDPSVDNTFMNVVGGAIAEIPKVAGEVGSFLGKASQYMPANLLGTALEAGFTDKTYGQLREEQKAQAEQLATAGQAGKEFVQKYGAYNPESTGAKVGETITDIGSAFVGPNKAKILKEGTGFVKGILPKTLNLATEGALAGAKYDVATKGEVTPEGVGYGAGGNLVFGAGAKLLGKGYNALTSKLPASITLGGLINPGKLDVVKKSLQMDEGIATPEDVGKWILDRVKPGNKQQIAEQLIQHAEKTKGAVDEALASIPTYYKNPEAKKALLQIRNELEGKVGLEGKLAKIDEMLAKPDYTLSELNAVKRELDDMYNLYTKTGDPTAGLKAEGLRNVRANIRGFIEDEAEKLGVNVRKLNNETSTARGLADGILRKDSADGVRELLTAFAPSGAGAVVGAGQAIARGEDPLTIMRDALIGGVATKLGTSTTVRTRIASALNKLVPKELTALENYIKSGGKDAIGKKVAEKVIREGRALPSRTITKPSDFANPTEKSIITPQTMEKGIIQESKQGLSPNIKRQNGNTNNTTSNSSNIPIGSKKVQEPIVKPNSTTNAKQPRNIVEPSTKSDSDIPEGYFKNAFGEIVKNPSNKNGGFIKVPGGKPVEKTVKAISNEELDALTKKATELGKYDGSYDVTKGKKLYRGGSEDGVFWTDDIDIAKSFGDEGVAEKIITMKKPLDVRSKDIREYIKKNTDINIDDATSAYSRSLPEFKKLMKWAKENGYDGIIGKTSDNGLNFTGNEFVTLSPPKPLSQQKTVKPLTEGKQSATMGDMDTKKLIEDLEEKIPKPDEKFLAKFAEGKTLDEFMGFVRGSSTQYGGYEPRLRRYLRPESKRLDELVPKDPNTRMITIYRGIDKSENPRIKSEIKGGDFVTTSYDDALSYTDSPANVVSKRVPISTLVTEFPEEFLKNNKGKSIGEIVDYELIWKPYDHPFYTVSDSQLKKIYEQSKLTK